MVNVSLNCQFKDIRNHVNTIIPVADTHIKWYFRGILCDDSMTLKQKEIENNDIVKFAIRSNT